MPFSFFRRRGSDAEDPEEPIVREDGTVLRRVRFDGLSDEWRLVGYMRIAGRLSDALNRREPIELSEMTWAALDEGGPLEPAPGLKQIDPYDLVIVLAGEESRPPLTEGERAAFRVHKLTYDVVLDVPPFEVHGRVYLYPGTDPSILLERSNEMFFPVTNAVALREGRRLDDPRIETILVNRFYLRGVEQRDLVVVGDAGSADEEPADERPTDDAGTAVGAGPVTEAGSAADAGSGDAGD